ncbi:Protein of unknown function (DUF2031), putative [Plasmodium chabaudi adami]|uniref:Fam-b protein n=1 Tax=Plasmodium chabaudi adami TaxID=5826 RepID=A0A1C6WPA1_PLACE|nr:Protein of unknown function (DUF2031), putative [Plasmodium chabaudi adami]
MPIEKKQININLSSLFHLFNKVKNENQYLKHVFFFNYYLFFEYSKNESNGVNERSIYLERNVINFRNNRILADADSQFDLYDFYQSTSSLANRFNDYNDDEEMACLLNMIGSHVNKNKENNTIFNLNNVDKKTKKLIYELQKEFEETKKELDNIRNDELAIQPIQDKRIIKGDGNISVSEQEFKQLENSENILDTGYYNFEDEYNEITSSNSYKKFKIDKAIIKLGEEIIKLVLYTIIFLMIIATGGMLFLLLLIPYLYSILKKLHKMVKLELKSQKYQ